MEYTSEPGVSQHGLPAVLGWGCFQQLQPSGAPEARAAHVIWLWRPHQLRRSHPQFPTQREPQGWSGVWPGSRLLRLQPGL